MLITIDSHYVNGLITQYWQLPVHVLCYQPINIVCPSVRAYMHVYVYILYNSVIMWVGIQNASEQLPKMSGFESWSHQRNITWILSIQNYFSVPEHTQDEHVT